MIIFVTRLQSIYQVTKGLSASAWIRYNQRWPNERLNTQAEGQKTKCVLE